MKRILSLLVVIALVLSMAPSVFAATGTAEDPIDLTTDLLYENDFSATVTVPAGTTHNFVAYRVGGMTMTINDGEPVACTTQGMFAPYAWSITNDGAEDAAYVIKVAYPAGSQMNPAELVTGTANYAVIEAGNTQGYYYNWTAPVAGTLSIELYASDADWNFLGWSYVINNMTTYVYGDMQYSDSDPVVNPGTVTVAAGDVIEIIVNTYNPADMWNNPAGEVSVTATFACAQHGETEASDNYDGTTHSVLCKLCGANISIENHNYVEGVCACGALIPGTEANPHDLTNDLLYDNDYSATVTVAAGTTYYCQAYRVGGMTMTINGGEPVACTTQGMFAPYTWSITNDGAEDAEYVIVVAYPAGSQMNPAELVTGMANYATIEAGSQGYYYNWTAPAAGTLSVELYASDADWNPLGWSYVINNMTTYLYGDTQWSDSDPVVNPGTVTVAAGDVIEIIVNTYNPADMWNNPAGDVSVTAIFTCAQHGETEVSDNYDGTTHSVLCKACGANISVENHNYVEGVCACGALIPGTEANPHDLTTDLLYEGDFAATITVAAGATYYCQAYRVDGMIMTINDGDAVVCTIDSMWAPYSWTITNDGAEDAEYVIKVAYPVGNQMNPEVLFRPNYIAVNIEAGNTQGYYYKWTAIADGELVLTCPTVEGIAYDVNMTNMTTYAQAWLVDSTDGTIKLAVSAGDEVIIQVAALPDSDWNTPALEVALTGEFVYPIGTQMNPEKVTDVTDIVVNIAAGNSQGYYYSWEANADGKLTLTCPTVEGVVYDVILTNMRTYAQAWLQDSTDGTVAIDVLAGDQIIIQIVTAPDAQWNYPALETTLAGELIGKNGWVLESNKWAFYVNGEKLVKAWQKDSKGWCYLGADGYMVTNAWVMDSKGWCYVGADGYCLTNCWVQDSHGWIYLDSEGSMTKNAWVKDSKGWCFLGEDGYMVYDSLVIDYVNGKVYAIGADGYMISNDWIHDGYGWAYCTADGSIAVNQWVNDGTGWYFIGANGYMIANAWAKDSKGWCYLGADGRMVYSQWVKDSQGLCWIDANGYWTGARK